MPARRRRHERQRPVVQALRVRAVERPPNGYRQDEANAADAQRPRHPIFAATRTRPVPYPQPTAVSAPPGGPAQLYPLGDAAVVVQFGDAISPATHAAIQSFNSYLTQHPFAGLRECVPAFTTLTVYYDPWLVSDGGRHQPYEQVAETLREMLAAVGPPAAAAAADLVEIPVCYGGEFGPDLAFVARHAGLSAAEVIGRHAAPEYLVHLIGFAPGFPYLGGLDATLATPRLAQPRPRVPAGTVGIAGPQTGIYSLPTPGGWQLIGRTPLRLFDAARAAPSLLHAGQTLRFVSISAAEYASTQQHEP
nr:5-oxoprolinase subunit PxpB [Hymenobacter sp. PAMC 26628]